MPCLRRYSCGRQGKYADPKGVGLKEGPPGSAWPEGPPFGNSSRQCLEASAPYKGCEEG